MTNNILKQTIQENQGGVEKGSQKRVIAYLFALTIITMCVYPTMRCSAKDIPLEAVGMLMTNLLIILGMGVYANKINPPAPPSAIIKDLEAKI